jgi:hypothetical protein
MRYAIVDGINVRDSRVHNYPPRWNGAPSQDLLVIGAITRPAKYHSIRCAGASFLTGVRNPWAGADRSTPNARLSGHSLVPGGLS